MILSRDNMKVVVNGEYKIASSTDEIVLEDFNAKVYIDGNFAGYSSFDTSHLEEYKNNGWTVSQ